jgi:hypothetical protein
LQTLCFARLATLPSTEAADADTGDLATCRDLPSHVTRNSPGHAAQHFILAVLRAPGDHPAYGSRAAKPFLGVGAPLFAAKTNRLAVIPAPRW